MHLSPSVAQFYITLSRIYLNLRRENDGTALLEEGLIQAPQNAARIYIEMGDIHKSASRYEEALNNYTKAALMEPELWTAHYKKGVALHSLTRIDLAEESLQKAYELKSDAAPTLHFLGMVSLAQNSPAEAEKIMLKAVALDSMSAEIWFHLGQSQMRQQKWAEARESLNRAHSLDSKISEVLYNLSEVNKRLEERDAAKIYAVLFKQVADFEEERDRLEKRLAGNPMETEMRRQLAELHERYGNLVHAAEYLRQAAYLGDEEAVSELNRLAEKIKRLDSN